jgi:uncharacterized membrane protein
MRVMGAALGWYARSCGRGALAVVAVAGGRGAQSLLIARRRGRRDASAW